MAFGTGKVPKEDTPRWCVLVGYVEETFVIFFFPLYDEAQFCDALLLDLPQDVLEPEEHSQ
jgi:hypothetical protein